MANERESLEWQWPGLPARDELQTRLGKSKSPACIGDPKDRPSEAASWPEMRQQTRRQFLSVAGVGTLGAAMGSKRLSRSLLRLLKVESVAGKEITAPRGVAAVPAPASTETGFLEASPKIARFEVVTVDVRGQETLRQERQAEIRTEDLGEGLALQMARIPEGEFLMGAPKREVERRSSEGSQHEVRVSEFWLGRFAVTQAQWRAIAQRSDLQQRADLEPNPAWFGGPERPVERISWWEAREFCARLSCLVGRSYRLPTEAEWEYACRAGTQTPFAMGPTITTDLANYRGASYYYDEEVGMYASAGSYGAGPQGKFRGEAIAVGSFPPNAFGLYDMHGNVWEWCEDNWHENYAGAPTDGSARLEAKGGCRKGIFRKREPCKVLRGGAWNEVPRRCRSAARNEAAPDTRNNAIGFRIACDVATAGNP